MTPVQILAYFRQLNYLLEPQYEEGLATFFNYLYNLGKYWMVAVGVFWGEQDAGSG